MPEDSDKPKSEQQKPEPERKFSQEQYDMLKRCSDNKDMTEWNKWREEYPDEEVQLQFAPLEKFWLGEANLQGDGLLVDANLQGAKLRDANLQGAKLEDANLQDTDLREANLQDAKLWGANLQDAHLGDANLQDTDLECANLQDADLWKAKLQDADLRGANLQDTDLWETKLQDADLRDANLQDAKLWGVNLQGAKLEGANLQGAKLWRANLQGADFQKAIVDGSTLIWECKVDRKTNFKGVGLESARIDPETKQLLQYNVRRMGWEQWCLKQKRWVGWVTRKFWEMSDYGISTQKVIRTFFRWAIVFAVIYYVLGAIDYYLIGVKDYPGPVADLFVDEGGPIHCLHVPLRSVYFSVVTMTTLGFGDMHANPHNFWWGWFGYLLLMVQVILGYVLLAALVTRFAVLFTAGGPAGKFAKEYKKPKDEQNNK